MDRTDAPTSLPQDGIVRLVGWPDALADAVGHPVLGGYVETYWLGILGPTASWLLRRLAGELQAETAGTDVDLRVLAGSLGLAYHPGRPNPFARGIDRLTMFGLVRHVSSSPLPTFAVRSRVPSLTRRQLERLPEQIRTRHPSPLVPIRA